MQWGGAVNGYVSSIIAHETTYILSEVKRIQVERNLKRENIYRLQLPRITRKVLITIRGLSFRDTAMDFGIVQKCKGRYAANYSTSIADT